MATSEASSLSLRKESKSPSNITVSSLMTLTNLFILIVPSMTIEPAINPNLGDLNVSLTSAVPKISSLISGSRWPSIISLILSKRS